MNELFPIYVKLENIRTLVVGGGAVALEKLQALINNSPKAQVHVVAEHVQQETLQFISKYDNIRLSNRSFENTDIEHVELVIIATNNAILNAHIRHLTVRKNILLNVADTPSLCDFYLGSVVQKGNLKVGISTNGKSPTIAKRLKEFFNDLLPEEIDETLDLMHQMRMGLKGNFQEKVSTLNAHTKDFLKKV